METPEDYSYKESEIPITITTDSPLATGTKGLKLFPLIKRYLFHIHMFDSNRDLPSDTPTEVYFTEFIPDAVTLPTSTFSNS